MFPILNCCLVNRFKYEVFSRNGGFGGETISHQIALVFIELAGLRSRCKHGTEQETQSFLFLSHKLTSKVRAHNGSCWRNRI